MASAAQALARNLRTAKKAAIRRAEKAARVRMRRLDRDLLDEVDRIYRTAADELRAGIAAYADRDPTLRLDVLQELLGQAQARLAALAAERNRLLEGGLEQAATAGAQIVAGAGVSAGLTQIADDAVRFVTTFTAADGLQLSDRLWRIDRGAREAVTRTIEQAVIQGHSASQATNDFLSRGEPVPADIRSKVDAASPERVARQAHQALMTGEMNPRDQAKRVFRTEINRAHGQAYQSSIEDDEDVIGTRFLLSPRHPKPDICDMHASVNRYGLGPGVYPKGKNPWPAHPNTFSYVEAVFEDEVTNEDRGGKEDRIEWLKRQPAAVQASVLGSVQKAWMLRTGRLRESMISTPWKVLKARLEREGVDIPRIGLAPEPTPVPTAGRAVSDALDVRGYKQASKHVLEVIDRAHRDGRLPRIPIERTTAAGYFGMYRRTLDQDMAVDIRLSSAAPQKEFTLAHELGHFLDHKGLPGAGMSSEAHERLAAWRAAVERTPEVRDLRRLLAGPAQVTIDGTPTGVPKQYLRYLLRWRELWARSYSQWLAARSGDATLTRQLAEIVNEERALRMPMRTQWQEASFGDVAEEIDKLFAELGWTDGN